MIKIFRLSAIVFFFIAAVYSYAQNFNQVNAIKNSIPGACTDKSCASVQPKAGSFSNAYTNTQCGLNYAISGVKLTQRATWQPGVGQPATMNISSIPPCVVPASGHILRAYVYWIVEGGPSTGSVNLTNPLGATQNFAGTLIGNISGGKCWSCSDTRHFRADVTAHITGNGNYSISGLPTSSGCGDTDGAVLVIIYRDPAATYQGTMVLHDGIILVNGGAQNHTLTGFSACAAGSNATAFTVIGDLQNNVQASTPVTMNGVTANVPNNFFNLDVRNVTVTAGQSSSLYGVNSSGDCWSWICAGLYFQTTTCTTCTPSGTLATPGAVSGPTTLCAGQTATYSIGSVSGATSYNWTVPSGWTITSGQGTTSINVTAGSANGNVCVTASNACGTSSPSCTNVTINTAPAQPGAITGSASVCSGQSLTYSISAVTGATSYTWSVPSGWTINSGQGTTSINVTTNSNTGNVCVTASNSCGTSPAQCLAITVGTAPATPGVITGSNPVCPSAVNTYSISVVGGATSYTWTVPSGWTINSGQGTTSISVTSGATGGNVCVTASNGCGTSAAQCTNITMNTNSAAPTSISASTNPTCGGSTTLTVVGGSLGTGATWNWFSGSCGGTPVGTGTSITVTPGSTTTYFVRAQGTCGNTSCASITITVNTNSTAATSINATTNPTCGGSTTLSVVGGSLGTGATWNWYSGSCGGTPVGTGNSITVTPGSTTTYFVQAIGTCNTTSCTSITITVNSPSTAPTSATANPSVICVGNSTTLTVNGGSLGTGAQWQWYSGSCGGPSAGTGSSITVSPSITTTYFVRAVGTCNTTTCVSVTVTVDQNPATSNAGPNQAICGLTTTLAGNTPSLGTGTWSQVSGPGTITFSNANSPSSTATASTFGTYVLQWTINNGSCSTSSNVSVTFDEMPVPSAAGSDAAICGLTINLNGNTPNVGVGAWSMQSGPGTITFGNSSSATSTATASVYGVYTLTWTFTNGACSNTDNVDITFDEMPNTADAGLDDAICGLTLTLNANAANIGTSNWTQLSGPGTLNFSNSGSNTSSVTASAYGTYTATWTIVNGMCNTSDNVTLTFDEMPNAANAGVNDSICGLITNLGGTQANIGISTWSQVSGPGTTTFNNPNQHTSGISVSTSGLYEYVLTIVNGTCVTSDTVSHHFFDAPTPVDAGADTAVCALSLNLNAQSPSLGSGTWTQIGGPVLATISNFSNTNASFDATQFGNYTLVWTVINGVCTLHDTVNVRLDQTPSNAIAGTDTTICTSDYLLDGNIPNIGNGVWSAINNGVIMSDSTSNMNYLSSLVVGVNTLVWTISNGVCPSSSDTIEITVNPSSIIPDFKTDTSEIYAYQVVAFIDLSSGNPDSWHWNFGDGDTSKIQNPGHIYTDIGIYPVMLVITNALGCRDTIIKDIEVKERFLVPNIFTPNNDGINDVFKVIASGYKDFSMQIYNRFGQIIFESFNPTIGWNGKTVAGIDVTVGTYFYIIKAVAPDGKEVIEKGPIQLLR